MVLCEIVCWCDFIDDMDLCMCLCSACLCIVCGMEEFMRGLLCE